MTVLPAARSLLISIGSQSYPATFVIPLRCETDAPAEYLPDVQRALNHPSSMQFPYRRLEDASIQSEYRVVKMVAFSSGARV